MRPLKNRTSDEGVEHHRVLPVRIYAEDTIQQDRVFRTRSVLHDALKEYAMHLWPITIIELGCGTGDISGPQHAVHDVYGIDCNPDAIRTANKRFPLATWECADIHKVKPKKADILIMSEFLEHLPEPLEMVKAWGRLADQVIISHPVDESVDVSGGEHQWAFSSKDFPRWFEEAHCKLVQQYKFEMHSYIIAVGRGVRVPLRQLSNP